MERQDSINLLISIQEQTGHYTDEQLEQLVENDTELQEQLQLLALTKQAFVKREADEEVIPVEEEWQRFAEEHFENEEPTVSLRGAKKLRTNDHSTKWEVMENRMIKDLRLIIENNFQRRKPNLQSSVFNIQSTKKKAAGIIGILFTAGVAFAAIHIVRMATTPKPQAVEVGQIEEVKETEQPEEALWSIEADSMTNTPPIVFDNVPLEKMLPKIAARYNKEVVFKNADACQLRFYFVWKQDETLDVVLHRLNLFESISIQLKDNKMIVE